MNNFDFSDKSKEPKYFSEQVVAAKRFYKNFNLNKTVGFSVVAGGRETCTFGYKINRETFPFYTIEFVAAGKGKLLMGNKEHELFPGAVFAYGPDIPHSIANLQREPLVKYFVNFSGTEACAVLADNLLLGKILYSPFPKRILDTFDEITAYGLTHSTAADNICATLVRLLILKISETPISHREATSLAFATYQRCRNLINNQYQNLKTLDEIAKAAHLDSTYLCRLFKRFDEQSPYQYMLKLKMNYATELLQEPGVLVKVVAYKLGFESQFHFSRTFKKVYGVSPTKFSEMYFK